MNVTVRAAEPGDYAAVCETMSQPIAQANTLQLPMASLEMWRTRLSEFPAGSHMLVAVIDGKVVGNLGLHPAAKQIRRRHVGALGMAVHDAYHGKGVGSALMRAAIDWRCMWITMRRSPSTKSSALSSKAPIPTTRFVMVNLSIVCQWAGCDQQKIDGKPKRVTNHA
jgi:putative acetyltransferase